MKIRLNKSTFLEFVRERGLETAKRGEWLHLLRDLRHNHFFARADDVRQWWHQERNMGFSESSLSLKVRQSRGR